MTDAKDALCPMGRAAHRRSHDGQFVLRASMHQLMPDQPTGRVLASLVRYHPQPSMANEPRSLAYLPVEKLRSLGYAETTLEAHHA
jgi:hypothetical protein